MVRFMSNNGGHLTVQYNLRWSKEFRDKIAKFAKENNRSMNQEILLRLEESFKNSEKDSRYIDSKINIDEMKVLLQDLVNQMKNKEV